MKKILVILIIGTILGLGGAILKNSPFSRDKRMLKQVSSIVSELRNNENTVSDSVKFGDTHHFPKNIKNQHSFIKYIE